MLRLLLACGLTVIPFVATAQIFECSNAAGRKEYANVCPPGTVQQRQVTTGGEAGSEAGRASKSIEVQGAEFRQRAAERQEAETKAEQERARADEFERNCIEAKAALQAVQDGQRLQRFHAATGERVNYTEDERAEAADRQRKAIGQWCK